MGMAKNPLETAQTGYTWLLIISFGSYVSVGGRWPETWGFFFSFLPPPSDLCSTEENNHFADWRLNMLSESSKNSRYFANGYMARLGFTF